MRACCEEASSYGERTHAAHQQLDNVLVLLNPVADKRSSPETVNIKILISFQMDAF